MTWLLPTALADEEEFARPTWRNRTAVCTRSAINSGGPRRSASRVGRLRYLLFTLAGRTNDQASSVAETAADTACHRR